MQARRLPTSTYVRYGIVALAACILVSFLFTKGNSVVREEHEGFQQQLRQLAQVDAELTDAVYRAQQGSAEDASAARVNAGLAADIAGQLEKGLPGFVTGEARDEIRTCILTAVKAFDAKKRLADSDKLAQMTSIPSRQTLDKLEQAYMQYYDRAFQAAHVHRLYLYAFSVVLAVALVYALLSLRGARVALHAASRNLDEKVRERTQELYESNASLQEVVAQLLETEASLRESKERFELAARGANDGLWDWDIVADRVYYSPRWKEMLGLNPGEVSERIDEWFSRVHPDDLPGVRQALDVHLEGETSHFDRVFRMRHQDGSHRWMLTRGIAIRDEEDKPRRMAGSQSDITDRKLVEERIRHEARHDGLTGLANRLLFLDRLDHAMKLSRRRSRDLFAVLFLDLDRFKLINDSLGHAAGDTMLRETAHRIESCLRASDTASRMGGSTVARLGGDEFAVLIENLPDPTAAVRVAERIQQKLSKPFVLENTEVTTSASIGIAMSSADYQTPDEILRDADTAMYRAKQLGKARHAIFDQEMHVQAINRLLLENELRHAVEKQEFELHFQPIISLKDGTTEGFEALLRWRHPARGLLAPSEFLGVLEEMGFSVQVGWWVIREACQKLREWQHLTGKQTLFMSVNFSSRQMLQAGMLDALEGILAESNLSPAHLNIEFTESVIMANPDAVGKVLTALHRLGVGRSLDDFGTGYSSLSYLHRFPITAVKIDRSLVSSMADNHDLAEIARAICVLANNLNINVVAEGIETPQQLDFLRTLHCEQGQGYFFARPLPAEEIPSRLAQVAGIQ